MGSADDARADNPGFFSNVEAGKVALTLHFDATSRKSGELAGLCRRLALTLPDGSAVTPASSQLTPLGWVRRRHANSRPVADVRRPRPRRGDYNLRLIVGDWFVGEDGVNEAVYDFSLS